MGNEITVSATFTDGRGYAEGPLTSSAVTIISRPAFFVHDFTTDGIGNFSFSRNSKAWHYDSNGQIVEFDTNIPAFGHSSTGTGDTLGRPLGLMIEPRVEGLHAGSISMVDEDDTTNGPGLWNGFNVSSLNSAVERIAPPRQRPCPSICLVPE